MVALVQKSFRHGENHMSVSSSGDLLYMLGFCYDKGIKVAKNEACMCVICHDNWYNWRLTPYGQTSVNNWWFLPLVQIFSCVCTITFEIFWNVGLSGNVSSQEMRLPGKCELPGNVTTREMWLLRKCELQGNITVLGSVPSREVCLPEKCDFLCRDGN